MAALPTPVCLGPRAHRQWPQKSGRGLALAVTLLALVVASCSVTRLANPANVRSMWDGDAGCVASARAAGRRLTRSDVKVWVQPDAPWSATFADEVNVGVRAARRFLAEHGLVARAPIEVYVCDRKVISHAPGGPFVFLARDKVEGRTAPWLHEALHVLLRGDGPNWLTDFDDAVADREMPLWLTEGLTEFVAQSTSEAAQVSNAGPFKATLAELDAACARAAARGPAEILEKVGRPGRADALFGPARFENATVFYPCATSFVAWLSGRHGLESLLQAARATPSERERWEELTGASLAAERSLWLRALAIAPP